MNWKPIPITYGTVTIKKLDTSYYAYDFEFGNGLVVTLRRVNCAWETECCGIISTHMFEDNAVRWAFELFSAV